MQHDPHSYLWDVREAADVIGRFVTGKTYADYTGDLLLRSAIERQFEMIGKALNQLSKVAPALAGPLPTLRASWPFGTCSSTVMPASTTIEESLPQLRTMVAGLLDELGSL